MMGRRSVGAVMACLLPLLAMSSSAATRHHIISGIVLDGKTLRPLAGANITLLRCGLGQTSDQDGTFRLADDLSHSDTLQVRYLGYSPFVFAVSFGDSDSIFLRVHLSPTVLHMPEITISASQGNLEQQLMALDPSAMRLSPEQLERVPQVAFPDLYRSLQKTQGITANSEVSPQLHIRGGNMDQNLVLLDGAPIYYPFHFLGISSSFNMDAIDDVNLSLGGFSAYFGNRLSSVLSLRTCEPDSTIKTRLNLHLIGADVTSSGRIGTKIGWLASFRASYFDLVNRLGVKEIPYRFSDGTLKLQFMPSDRHLVQLTVFRNYDQLDDDKESTHYLYSSVDSAQQSYAQINRDRLQWRNNLASLQWSFQLAKACRLHLTAYCSGYNNSFQKESLAEFPQNLDSKFDEDRRLALEMLNQYNRENQSHVENQFDDLGIKFSAEWRQNNNLWIAGIERSKYNANYSWDRLYDNLEDDHIRLFFDYAPNEDYSYRRAFTNTSGFAEGRIKISDSLYVRPGLRATRWSYLPKTIFEPRFAIYYADSNWHLSFAVGHYSQGIATALEEGLVGFLELYFPAESLKAVQSANHYLVDFAYNFSPKTKLSAAVYYKTFSSLLKAVDENPTFRESTGTAKGIELALVTQFKGWNLTGNYTWSHSRRKYGSLVYDSNFDQRHRLQFSLHRQLANNLDIDFYWEFHTGQPYCPGAYYAFVPIFPSPTPTQNYEDVWYEAYVMDISRDRIRYPYYHRLDVSLTWQFYWKQAVLSPYLSVYNAYWRKNVLYYRKSKFTYDLVDGAWKNPHLERDPFTLPMIPTIGMKIRF